MSESDQEKGGPENWVSGRTIAYECGVDPSLITVLRNQGHLSAPTGTTPNKGKYWRPSVMREMYQYALRQGTGQKGSLADRAAELKLDNEGLRLRRQQREEAHELNQLIPFVDALGLLVDLQHLVSGQVENLGPLLEQRCAMAPEQVEEMQNVIHSVLEAIEEEHVRAEGHLQEDYPQGVE